MEEYDQGGAWLFTPHYVFDFFSTLDASQFAGEVVQTWLGFISENGQKAATSIFTGEVPLVI